jgi:hypothetical protein
MATRDPKSADANAPGEAGKTVAQRRSQPADHKPVPPDIGWVRSERRHPDNARIRRWMDLGDKALQNLSEEEEDPINK